MAKQRGYKKQTHRRSTRKTPVKGILIVVLTAIVLGLAVWGVQSLLVAQTQARLERIEAIYANLNLEPQEYALTSSSIFGERKPYDSGKEGSRASSVSYVHSDSVSATFARLDKKIRAAGFTFVSEPNPGSIEKQYRYKAKSGEYLHLVVVRQVFADATTQESVANSDLDLAMKETGGDIEQGPSKVTIRVNLDHNTE